MQRASLKARCLARRHGTTRTPIHWRLTPRASGSIGPTALVTVATAERALSNGDGSEIQLLGNAVVVREPATDAQGNPVPRLEFRSDFLHVFVNTERVRTHKPVVLLRGADRFSAEAMDYDNVDRVLELHERVRGVIAARPAP